MPPGMREHNLVAGQLVRVPTTQPTYPANKPTLAVDHVYHSAAFRPVKFSAPASNAADHRPLLVDLELNTAASRPR